MLTTNIFLVFISFFKCSEPQTTTTTPDPRNVSTTFRPSEKWSPSIAFRLDLEIQCEFLSHYCSKAYQTGEVCGRTVFYKYKTFKSYCVLDYVNCMREYDVWMIAYMGPCYNVTLPPTPYVPETRTEIPEYDEMEMSIDRIAEMHRSKRIFEEY